MTAIMLSTNMQATFASEFTSFLTGIANASPLKTTLCGRPVYYLGNDSPAEQTMPGLLNIPGLPSRDVNLIDRMESEYAFFTLHDDKDVMLDNGLSLSTKSHRSLFGLYEEVGYAQGVVDHVIDEAGLPLENSTAAFGCAQKYVDRVMSQESGHVMRLPLLLMDMYLADHFLMSATVLTSASAFQCKLYASDQFERAAYYYHSAKLYAAAAMMMHASATIDEFFSQMETAAYKRRAAAENWNASLTKGRPRHAADLDEIEIYLGLRNGLAYEEFYGNSAVDELIDKAAEWSRSNARDVDAADASMALILRQLQRPDVILPKGWRQISRTILDAARIWHRSGKAHGVMIDAVRLALAACALGGDPYEDLFELMSFYTANPHFSSSE